MVSNPSGNNAHGKKNYPPDNVLKESLLKYVSLGLKQGEKLVRLAADHGLDIKTSTLNNLERKLDIPSVRRQKVAREELVQAIVDEVEKDLNQNNGPNYIKGKLKDKSILVPRDIVRSVMHTIQPGGAEQRYPGRNKSKIKRQQLSALGPFHEVAADGHEKIGALALQMDGIGLPIYAYRDKWTGKLLLVDVVPDCRSAGAIGHLFLDFVEDLGGIPLQLNLDKGLEIGWEVAFQSVLRYAILLSDDAMQAESACNSIRETFAPEINPDVYKSVALLKSVHNIIIEALWRWLREKSGHNMRDVILHGKTHRLINGEIPCQRYLFYWIFVPLIRAELKGFQTWWNQRRVRFQKDKDMPSDHVPSDAVEHPELLGGLDCLIRVPGHVVEDLREFLGEEAGPRDQFLSFFPVAFNEMASGVFQQIGCPLITFSNSWKVFSKMLDVIEST